MLQLNNEIKYIKSLLLIKIRVYIGYEWLGMIMTIRGSAKVHHKKGIRKNATQIRQTFFMLRSFFNKIRVRNRFWIVIIILRHSYSPLANRVLVKCCVRKFIADYFCIYFFVQWTMTKRTFFFFHLRRAKKIHITKYKNNIATRENVLKHLLKNKQCSGTKCSRVCVCVLQYFGNVWMRVISISAYLYNMYGVCACVSEKRNEMKQIIRPKINKALIFLATFSNEPFS